MSTSVRRPLDITAMIARLAMGALFVIFGLNGFLHVFKQPPHPALGGQLIELLGRTHYLAPVFAIEVVCGILFLAGRYVPLALAAIAPVIVNIMIFHVLLDPGSIASGLVALICWVVVFARYRAAFAPLFEA